MELGRQSGVDWKKLFAQRGFRFFFAGVFVSLCGSGMNFAGVTWYVLGRTNSTVQVSLLLILMTIPGLFVPLFGGVLIDRVDRRYLGMTLDIARGLVVAGIATLFFLHRAGLGSIYTMVILLGVGSAMYWSNINALVQEVISSGELVAANSAVLIAVQGGLAISGGLVGFIYDRAGIAGILAIDASSYFISAFCLYRLRRGYFAPHVTHRIDLPESLETPLAVAEETSMPPLIEPAFESGFIAEFREGIGYLRSHPNILALGITYACMIAGVISSNVLVVALTKDILHAGATGLRNDGIGLGGGSGGGRICGGISGKAHSSGAGADDFTGYPGDWQRAFSLCALAGHCHDHARNFRGLPRAGRSADAVRDYDGCAATADGADSIDFCGAFNFDADHDEFFAGVAGGIFGIAGCVCVVGDYLCRRGGGGVSRAFDGAGEAAVEAMPG